MSASVSSFPAAYVSSLHLDFVHMHSLRSQMERAGDEIGEASWGKGEKGTKNKSLRSASPWRECTFHRPFDITHSRYIWWTSLSKKLDKVKSTPHLKPFPIS